MLSASLSKRDRLGSQSIGGASQGGYSELPGLKARNGSFAPKTAGVGSMGLTGTNFGRGGPGGMRSTQRSGVANRTGTSNTFVNN
jgi:hypothetical protein